ncbi:MAG: bacillithiol biosynthesis cysteine-adding enzyme BshC [Cyclobacteriaceae bacterium]
MKIVKLSFFKTGTFSPIFLDYINNEEKLEPFYNHRPDLEGFKAQLKEKKFSQAQRNILTETLERQYKGFEQTETVSQNIAKLADDNTFTVTTGHQLNIFTGPLYFIYKIVTTINTCKKLQEAYPDYHFVPVYWMASEDHDFEEISHFHLFGKDYVWQTDQQGAVGRFKTDSLSSVLEEMPEQVEMFEKAYLEQENLADAVRYYVNELFGKHGLIVLDADDAALKASFRSVMADDLKQHTAKALTDRCSGELEKLGYKAQVYPREINFFYLDEQLRERIELENGKYQVLNTDISFTEQELMAEMEKHPEKFSPNVILRPLYQETILPNLAYIGGPSELAYWLQLKPVFDHYQLPFPILMPRNFGLVINKSNARKLDKLPVQVKDLFRDTQALIARFVEENADGSISLAAEEAEMAKIFDKVREKAAQVDKSLEGFIGKEEKNALKSLQNIEKRLKKSEERNQETQVKQLESLKDKLFPGGSLQERKENFLNFQINNPQFVDELLTYLDPFDYRFNILNESDDY